MRSLLAVGLFISTPAMAADQFDLLCTFGETPVRFRVDLTRNEACRGDCLRVWKMGAVTSGEIRLMDTVKLYPDEVPQTMTVNRQTGVLEHQIFGGALPIVEHASCTPAPFSGFPAAKF